MKPLLLSLVLAALLAPGASSQSRAARVAPVTLYTDFQQAVPQTVVDALRNEVESLMSPRGFRFDWIPLSDFRTERASAAVAVAHFEGRCDVADLVMRGNQSGSLGWTEISDGTVLPFTHLDCERVRTFLQTTLLGYRPQDRELAYGRALGRVLAHELLHVFGETPKHAAAGVAKEKYSVEDLLAAEFPFHEKSTRTQKGSKTLAALRAASRDF